MKMLSSNLPGPPPYEESRGKATERLTLQRGWAVTKTERQRPPPRTLEKSSKGSHTRRVRHNTNSYGVWGLQMEIWVFKQSKWYRGNDSTEMESTTTLPQIMGINFRTHEKELKENN